MDDGQVMQAAARRYAAWFETLSPARLGELDGLVAPSVRFRDPFNDVTGVQAMRRVLEKMFEDVPDTRFTITDIGFGAVAYLRWRFQGGKWSADGVSEIAFDGEGRVTSHIDHWDSGRDIYAKLPVIGAVIRLIRGKIAAAP